MFNPILGALVAHEQHKDLIREADQQRLVDASVARRPARRFDLRIPLGNVAITVRQMFKALARAN